MPIMRHPRNGACVCVCGGGGGGIDQSNWEPDDPEGYAEEDAAYEVLDDEDDQEDADEVDGSVMQVEMLPPGDDG
eukprot:4472400-Prorocentrum_lima.AAC.1